MPQKTVSWFTVEMRMAYLLFKGRFRPTAGVLEEFSTHSNRRDRWCSAKMVHFSLPLTRAAEPLAHSGSVDTVWTLLAKSTLEERGQSASPPTAICSIH